ncbi:MAG: hypothetical protein KBT20_05335 [Bacteroidales bacterium]|nr:hypothetical protein [Candidatus Liminaster caballi]
MKLIPVALIYIQFFDDVVLSLSYFLFPCLPVHFVYRAHHGINNRQRVSWGLCIGQEDVPVNALYAVHPSQMPLRSIDLFVNRQIVCSDYVQGVVVGIDLRQFVFKFIAGVCMHFLPSFEIEG